MDTQTKQTIENDIKSKKVFVYMKGTPDAPQCGFSYNTINIVKSLGVDYGTRDILADEKYRQGIKELTNWPTIPQVFVNGEFIGGNDILVEMYQSGELHKMLGIAKQKA
jgi:monothiol glutaredoxin